MNGYVDVLVCFPDNWFEKTMNAINSGVPVWKAVADCINGMSLEEWSKYHDMRMWLEEHKNK